MHRLELVLEGAGLGTWQLDLTTGEFSADARGRLLHGQPPEPVSDFEEAGLTILEEDREAARNSVQSAAREGREHRTEYRVRMPDGSLRWIAVYGRPLNLSQGPQMFGVVQDITPRRQAEEEARRHALAIEELNTRLQRGVQETHHRVKNNLQVIAALAEMESLDRETISVTVLHRIAHHARTLAVIHDILTHQSREHGRPTEFIMVGQIIEKLMPLMESTIGERKIQYTLDDFPVTAREGAAIALLINELVSNSVKHGGDHLEVVLTVVETTATLTIADNGPGFPPGFDAVRAANTGLELVQNVAVWDLRGTVQFSNRETGGASVIATFPLPTARNIPILPG